MLAGTLPQRTHVNIVLVARGGDQRILGSFVLDFAAARGRRVCWNLDFCSLCDTCGYWLNLQTSTRRQWGYDTDTRDGVRTSRPFQGTRRSHVQGPVTTNTGRV